jgi:hypothetical protein
MVESEGDGRMEEQRDGCGGMDGDESDVLVLVD